MSLQSSEELTLLECFPVPEAGVFSVSVYEVQHDGMVGRRVWRLSDITTGPNTDENVQSVKKGIFTCAYYITPLHRAYAFQYSVWFYSFPPPLPSPSAYGTYGRSCSDWTCYCARSCLCGSGCADSCYIPHEKENEQHKRCYV